MTTTPEQIEAVGRALAVAGYRFAGIELTDPYSADAEYWNNQAIAAINTMRPFIRDEVLEEAAVVAAINWLPRHEITSEFQAGVVSGRLDAAAAIRALKEKKNG